MCTTVLSNFDTDALATLFPNTSLSAPFRRIFYPGPAFTIGQDLRDRKVKLFLAPFDPDLEAGFLLAEAVPIPGEGAICPPRRPPRRGPPQARRSRGPPKHGAAALPLPP